MKKEKKIGLDIEKFLGDSSINITNKGIFGIFPEEVIVLILNHLDGKTLINMSRTSSFFYKVITERCFATINPKISSLIDEIRTKNLSFDEQIRSKLWYWYFQVEGAIDQIVIIEDKIKQKNKRQLKFSFFADSIFPVREAWRRGDPETRARGIASELLPLLALMIMYFLSVILYKSYKTGSNSADYNKNFNHFLFEEFPANYPRIFTQLAFFAVLSKYVIWGGAKIVAKEIKFQKSKIQAIESLEKQKEEYESIIKLQLAGLVENEGVVDIYQLFKETYELSKFVSRHTEIDKLPPEIKKGLQKCQSFLNHHEPIVRRIWKQLQQLDEVALPMFEEAAETVKVGKSSEYNKEEEYDEETSLIRNSKTG